MKKLIALTLICAFGVSVFAETADSRAVYNFRMSLKTPTVYGGVRTYKGQTYKGYLYADYSGAEITRVWAEVKSSVTKVTHVIEFDAESGFYNLMGKSNSKSERTVPTIWFTGNDIENEGTSKYGNHETITNLVLAGSGSLRSIKTTSSTVGCTTCQAGVTSTSYCNILVKASGYVTGVMNCECPDEEDWDHTLKAGACGVLDDEVTGPERDHFASTFGSWAISYKTIVEITD